MSFKRKLVNPPTNVDVANQSLFKKLFLKRLIFNQNRSMIGEPRGPFVLFGQHGQVGGRTKVYVFCPVKVGFEHHGNPQAHLLLLDCQC